MSTDDSVKSVSLLFRVPEGEEILLETLRNNLGSFFEGFIAAEGVELELTRTYIAEAGITFLSAEVTELDEQPEDDELPNIQEQAQACIYCGALFGLHAADCPLFGGDNETL